MNATPHPSLLSANGSLLAMIDVQERLFGAMPAEAAQALEKNCGILLQAARLLDIPTVHTEQYPKGLGPTLASLNAWCEPRRPIEKTCFSCCDSPAFNTRLRHDLPQIVLAGMESHICILQTAFDLHAAGKQVFVVEDAVLSRTAENKANALHRMRQAGITVTNTESVVFEWLGRAEGDAFKQISKLVR